MREAAKERPAKVFNQITSHNSDSVEILSVVDPNYKEPHVLLLTTSRQETLQRVQDQIYRSGKIDIRADYLMGPLEDRIGGLVCDMGGADGYRHSLRISNGDIMVRMAELRGLKISSFMLNRVVRWAKCFEADRTIRPFKLVHQDGVDPANRSARNKLYRKFGMRLIFTDPVLETEGYSDPTLTVDDLIEFSDREWPTVSATTYPYAFRALSHERHKIKDRLTYNTRRMLRYKRENDRFDLKVGKVMRALRILVNWPLLLLVAFLAYGLGSSQLGTYLDAIKQFLS